MAILHIVSTHLSVQSLSKLVHRSNTDDAFVFMDDGVYCSLSLPSYNLSGRSVYLLHEHSLQRGLDAVEFKAIHVDMVQLVALTVRYCSSMTW